MHYAKRHFKDEFVEARMAYQKALANLKAAKLENDANVIEFEYEVTNALGALNKVRDKIRIAKEEDFIDA
jgi:hypothetical protein